jgi:hypothetical protein
MKRFGSLLLVVLSTIDFAASQSGGRSEGWISLFDGKSLAGWKASDKEGTFQCAGRDDRGPWSPFTSLLRGACGES